MCSSPGTRPGASAQNNIVKYLIAKISHDLEGPWRKRPLERVLCSVDGDEKVILAWYNDGWVTCKMRVRDEMPLLQGLYDEQDISKEEAAMILFQCVEPI